MRKNTFSGITVVGFACLEKSFCFVPVYGGFISFLPHASSKLDEVTEVNGGSLIFTCGRKPKVYCP
jgi:hypothetical protein